MPSVTGNFAQLLERDLRRVYIEAGRERPLEYPAVFNIESMETSPTNDQQMAGLSTMPPKDQGTQFTLDDPIMGPRKTYNASAFGLGFEVTWEMWRDDQYGVMRSMAAELGRSGRHRQEVEAWAILNNAFTTTVNGFTASEALCATSHTGLDGIVRSNRPSTDITLSVTALQGAIESFEGLTNERNLPQLLTPTTLVINESNRWTAREVLGSSQVPFSANNELNSLIPDEISWMISHYLTTATNWFLMARKGEHDLNYMWRDRPIFDAFDDPRTKNAVFTSYQRLATGYGSWRGIYGSTGA